jgi:hypothetical protein
MIFGLTRDPVLERWHRVAGSKEPVVAAQIAQEREPRSRVGEQLGIAAEAFDVRSDAAERTLERDERLRVLDRAGDLLRGVDDRVGCHQAVDVELTVVRHSLDVELVEACAERIPARIDERPRQAGLKDRAGDGLEVVV